MNNKIIFFHLNKPLFGLETWTENGQKYLLFNFLHQENYIALLPPREPPLLIVPDNNSSIVNQIKNRQKNDYFTTSFDNLKLKHDFLDLIDEKNPGSWLISGLLVKDISRLEKVNGNCPDFPKITFKVISRSKLGYVEGTTYEESFRKYGSYSHQLEIEPLDLGIEGMPSITRIIFDFADPIQPALWKPLTKTKLYNSAILTESVGKTFTMKVKSWNFNREKDMSALSFGTNWDFCWNSFQELVKNDTSPHPKPKKVNNKSSETNSTLKTVLIIGGIVGGLLLIFFIFWYFCKKKSSLKK